MLPIKEILSIPANKKSFDQRFSRHVVKAPNCWGWTGPKNQHGYPVLGVGKRGENKILRVSRCIYWLEFGDFDYTLLVCHTCDNPECVNPSHLFLGTHKDNTQDMLTKGRGSFPPHFKGESHPNSTLTDEIVLKIAADKGFASELAAKYSTSKQTIWRIRSGRERVEASNLSQLPTRENYKGTNNPSAKLTESEVIEIFKESGSHGKIASKYNITRPTVTAIKNLKTWKSLLIPLVENTEMSY
jgi:HNH endonuclease